MKDIIDVFGALAEPFEPKQVSWRVGSTNKDKTKGLALAYIDARDVMERLDAVLGPANWQDKYEVHGGKTICYLSLRVSGEWITKADAAGDSAVEAEKGAISDAFKRAAVKWGVGRYLYDLGNTWVELENQKFISKADQQKLPSYLPAPDKRSQAEVWTNKALPILKALAERHPDLYAVIKEFSV